MRFCPFCSAENADEQAVCAQCGRRLPPLPPRRARNAPATGVQLPPRAPSAMPVRTPPAAPPPAPMPAPAAPPSADTSRPVAPAAPHESSRVATTLPLPTQAPVPPEPRRAGNTNPPPIQSTEPRRAGNTNPPPIQSAEPRRAGTTMPPPVAESNRPGPSTPGYSPQSSSPGIVVPQMPPPAPGTMVSPGAQTARPGTHVELPPAPPAPSAPSGAPAAPMIGRDSAPALPPPPQVDDPAKQSLLNAISPGPAAQRREAPAPEPRDGGRRAEDAPRTKPTTLPPALPTRAPARPGSPSSPPPLRAAGPPQSAFNDDFNTVAEAPAFEAPPASAPPVPAPQPPRLPPPVTPPVIESSRSRPSGDTPPPTRINRVEAHADRPFTPPKVDVIPEIPEPGLYPAARYAVRFTKARWQRRGAIKTLGAEIKQDTEALDQVLGALGKVARSASVDGRVFSAENTAINAAEERIKVLNAEHGDVDARKAEENSRFVDIERERNSKLTEAERMVDEVTKELAHLEGQRRGLRDKRKELERRQKAYLRSAEDNDKQAGNAQMGDTRAELRRSAEQHRKEAAALEPERQEVDRRLASLERPIGEATARLDAAKAELDAAKRSLSDAREGHGHRLAELDAEQKRKSREISQAEGEVARRLVTLGTLVNLNRIDDPQFDELYQRIDRLRGAITARTTEIEKLTAEREAYDRGALLRGVAVMGGAVIALIALIVILRAIL